MEIVRSWVGWVVVVAAALGAGCQPQTSCPSGLVVGEGGRCVASDGGAPHGDGGRDAGVGPDGCALSPFFGDADGDGHGDPGAQTFACVMPEGFAPSGDDCEDTCIDCHPGAHEVCGDGRDQDCDGTADQGCGCTDGASQPCGASSVGACHLGMQTCAGGAWGTCVGATSPSTETCNAIDDDCDGRTDEGAEAIAFYPDGDGDGHGDAMGTPTMACTPPAGFVASHDDCDDASAMRAPGLSETCDGIDNDCHGAADDTFACVRGAPVTCTTSCHTQGTALCSATCAAPTPDSCSPPVEACDGVDQDCDGGIDEGLGVVGAAATVSTAAGHFSPHVVGLSSGFGVVYATSDQLAWQTISSTGGSPSTALPLGTDTTGYQFDFDAAFDGRQVVIAGQRASDYQVFGIDPATGGRSLAPFVLPRGALTALVSIRIARIGAGTVTLYGVLRSGTTGYQLRRWVLGTSGTIASVLDSDDVATDLDATRAWSVAAHAGGEVVLYRQATSLDVVLRSVSTAGVAGASAVVRTASAAPGTSAIAIAVRDPSAAIGATNPIGVVLAGAAGTPLRFHEITSLSAPAGSTSTMLPGSAGTPPGLIASLRPLALAAPAGTTAAGLFYVTALEHASASDTSHFVLRAWELRDGAVPSARTLAVPDEMPLSTVSDISVAASGTTMRVAEPGRTGGIVTRQLGCR